MLLISNTIYYNDLNKLEFSVPENASKQVTTCMVNWFLIRFLKIFLYIFLGKELTSLWTNPNIRHSDLNKLESTAHDDTLTQV